MLKPFQDEMVPTAINF